MPETDNVIINSLKTDSVDTLTQTQFINECESFIIPVLEDYKIVETEVNIESNVSVGAVWSKRIFLMPDSLYFANYYQQNVYQDYDLTFIYFKDIDSCLKARQNYLDHYSMDGKLTAETDGVKGTPTFNLINDYSIIILGASCEGHHMDEVWSWEVLKNNLISTFGTERSETIEHGCGGPITWKNNQSARNESQRVNKKKLLSFSYENSSQDHLIEREQHGKVRWGKTIQIGDTTRIEFEVFGGGLNDPKGSIRMDEDTLSLVVEYEVAYKELLLNKYQFDIFNPDAELYELRAVFEYSDK